ncbi:hypothetical protein MPER_12192 [Moniliophthora perniciosa FA553]|nr:hypothetical protein MPER_12192 [Moniliophthora perniciosa FA553]
MQDMTRKFSSTLPGSHDAYRLWDTLPANSIVTASMEFVTGCVLEEDAGIRSMKIRATAASWPYFLRTKTGVASAYSFMMFPRLAHPNLRSYIQVIGDINLFIDLTNDVLSFHKESLEGETWNYVSNRSATTGKSVLQTYRDITTEVLSSHDRICATLDGPELLAWKRFVNGYLAFHITQDRYRLEEILPAVTGPVRD